MAKKGNTNRILMIIFGTCRDEITGKWTGRRNQELQTFYVNKKFELLARQTKKTEKLSIELIHNHIRGAILPFWKSPKVGGQLAVQENSEKTQ